MTICSTILIVGRPAKDADGLSWETRDRLRAVEGFEALYQGDAYVGVSLGQIHDQCSPTLVAIVGEADGLVEAKLDLVPHERHVAEARRLCAAIPADLEPLFLPFGVYLVSDDA